MHEATMQYSLAAYFASRMDPCTGIVEPFKHLLHVTGHPQFLALELRAAMAACSGQYGTYIMTLPITPHTSPPLTSHIPGGQTAEEKEILELTQRLINAVIERDFSEYS